MPEPLHKSGQWRRSPLIVGLIVGIVSVLLTGICSALLMGWQTNQSDKAANLKNTILLAIKEELKPINERLQKQGEEIAALNVFAFPNSLNIFKDLDQKVFSSSLPALRQAIKATSSKKIPDESTLRAISQKLQATDENAPDYWPTVLQFIKFASSRFNPAVPPRGKDIVIISNNKGFGIRLPPF